jgi:hypothetical protein
METDKYAAMRPDSFASDPSDSRIWASPSHFLPHPSSDGAGFVSGFSWRFRDFADRRPSMPAAAFRVSESVLRVFCFPFFREGSA